MANQNIRSMNEDFLNDLYVEVKKNSFNRDVKNVRLAWEISRKLSDSYSTAITSKQDIVKDFDGIRQHYLVNAILNSYIDDLVGYLGDIVSINTKDPEIQKNIDKLQETIDIDRVIRDIIYDLLGYGEYVLRTVIEPDKGLVGLMDDVDQTKVVPLYDKGYPIKYISAVTNYNRLKGKVSIDGSNLILEEPYKYIHFTLGHNKIRLNLSSVFDEVTSEELPTNILKDIPSYVRIGTSVLYGVSSKIRELMTLEALVPAKKISDLTSSTLVNVRVPPNLDVEEGFEVAQKVEDILNKHLGGVVMGNGGMPSVNAILEMSQQLKVLPVFGEKGDLSPINLEQSRSVDDIINQIQDLRNVSLNSIGIPPELIFGGEVHSESIRRYSRYLRKLKSIQSSISFGIKQIVMIHLVNSGVTFNLDDINISFNNEIISLDEIEKLDFLESTIASIKSIKEFTDDLRGDEYLKNFVDLERIPAIMHNILNSIGRDVSSIIKIPTYEEGGEFDTENPSTEEPEVLGVVEEPEVGAGEEPSLFSTPSQEEEPVSEPTEEEPDKETVDNEV